jgi:hypothetical protein
MQPQSKNTTANQLKSTQNSLLISEIKDGVVILKDGSLRAVVLASAINFDLMSQAEQDAVEYSYQNFLNSLHFPIQIVIRSQKITLDNYLADLEQKQAAQDNELLAMLMEDYIANIRSLIEEVNIMSKQFYVVIPFFPPVVSKEGFFANLSGIFKGAGVTTVQENDFNEFKKELSNRVSLVAGGLNQMGIRAIPLNTQELIDLYYSTYNPDVAINQKLIEAGQMQTPLVTRGTAAPKTTEDAPTLEPARPEYLAQQTPVAAPAPAYAPEAVVAPEAAEMTYQMPAVPTAPAPEMSYAPVAPAEPLPAPAQVSTAPAINPTNFDPFAMTMPVAAVAPAEIAVATPPTAEAQPTGASGEAVMTGRAATPAPAQTPSMAVPIPAAEAVVAPVPVVAPVQPEQAPAQPAVTEMPATLPTATAGIVPGTATVDPGQQIPPSGGV